MLPNSMNELIDFLKILIICFQINSDVPININKIIALLDEYFNVSSISFTLLISIVLSKLIHQI